MTAIVVKSVELDGSFIIYYKKHKKVEKSWRRVLVIFEKVCYNSTAEKSAVRKRGKNLCLA